MKDHILELRRKKWIHDWSSQLYTQPKQLWKKYDFHIFIYILTFYEYFTNSQYHQLPVGLIAQLIEHCTGNAEVMGLNPVQAWIFSDFNFTTA